MGAAAVRPGGTPAEGTARMSASSGRSRRGIHCASPVLNERLAAAIRPSPSHPRTVASSIGLYRCPSPPMT